MKDFYLTILRDKTTSLEAFRSATKQLGAVLLAEAAQEIPISIQSSMRVNSSSRVSAILETAISERDLLHSFEVR